MALRISDQQAKALGVERHIPKRAARSNLNELGQNKTEARFARHLEDVRVLGGIREYGFERIKFRLAGRTFYTPDFDVVQHDGSMMCFEVKGFWRDDARVKIKVAADKFRHIGFVAVRWVDGTWEQEPIGGRGPFPR
jgi:hypothetical protein